MPWVLFVYLLTAFGQDDNYIALRKQGVHEGVARHIHESQVLLEKALDAAQRAGDPYEAALTYSALGDLYQEQLRYQDAERFYRKSIAILPREPARSHALANTWRHL